MLENYVGQVVKINQRIARAASILDQYMTNKNAALQTLQASGVTDSREYQHAMATANASLDLVVDDSQIDICAFAVVYDALVRAALGEQYSVGEFALFLSAQTTICKQTYGVPYLSSETENRICSIIYQYYATRI